jgi:hypothetical protein
LLSLPENTKGNSYFVKIKITNASQFAALRAALLANQSKYIYLDLSGSTITAIPKDAFNGCLGLTGEILPDGVTGIGDSAFFSCFNLTSIDIPDGVTTIGDSAFAFCNSLESIDIPASVTVIGDDAFMGNWGAFTVINIHANNKAYSSLDGVLYNKNKTVLIAYPTAKKGDFTTMPDSVKTIASNAFYACAYLSGITIADGVTGIGKSAFYGCYFAEVIIPGRVTVIEETTFHQCAKLTSVTIPAGVTRIGQYAFTGCNSLTSVTFQNTINSIHFSQHGAFLGDLRGKFYEGGGIPGMTNGTPGRYTTTAPVSSISKWTKQ